MEKVSISFPFMIKRYWQTTRTRSTSSDNDSNNELQLNYRKTKKANRSQILNLNQCRKKKVSILFPSMIRRYKRERGKQRKFTDNEIDDETLATPQEMYKNNWSQILHLK